jgi:hypothetical protein
LATEAFAARMATLPGTRFQSLEHPISWFQLAHPLQSLRSRLRPEP